VLGDYRVRSFAELADEFDLNLDSDPSSDPEGDSESDPDPSLDDEPIPS
jgi:hypothetical protein